MTNTGLLFEKNKDSDWFKEVFESIVPFNSIAHEDYDKLISVYGIINNDLQYLTGYLNAMDNPAPELMNAPFEDFLKDLPIMYNRIFPKFMYHVGQMVNVTDRYNVIPLNKAADKFKQDEFDEVVSEFVQLAMLDSQKRVELQMQGLSKEQIMEEVPERERPSYDSFTSSVEQFYSDLVEYFHCTFPVKELKYATA